MSRTASRRGSAKNGTLKRKLELAFQQLADQQPAAPRSRATPMGPAAKAAQIRQLVETLSAASSDTANGSPPDRAALRKSAHQLAEFCKQDESIDLAVSEGAIEAVVPLLHLPAVEAQGSSQQPAGEELEKEVCFILGLLAVKPEYQTRIASCNALPGLVRLLREHRLNAVTKAQPGSGGAARRAADALTNLAHENVEIKNMVREQGGIPPLVALLEAMDLKVQRAAAGSLRTLAFKNEDNKKQIVECGALPILIQMLRSEDTGVHYEAVGVIGNLVHSSQHIKRQVLEDGALQPVISLLSSTCNESKREAALLLGQFATTDLDTKAKIVQRGAVPLLVCMLSEQDTSLKEMAAFALGRLAQNSDNQAGIVQCQGLSPLLDLLESKHHNLQHNAAFALYGLADNEDNIPDIIRSGALQRLMEASEKLSMQASKDCVQKTITRMEQKLTGRVLAHVVFMLRSGEKVVRQRAAMSLARLAPESQIKAIFVDKRGLDVLLDMLVEPSPDGGVLQREASNAVLELEKKIKANAPIDCSSQPAQPAKTVYLGKQYVNNQTLADITFLVEGRHFYAHRIALLASSDAFRAMFNGGYREKEAATIEIPNIPWRVFEAMMTYIYTGSVEVAPELASDLLQASDQYLLEGLKRLCEDCIAQSLSVDSLVPTFELSEAYSAPQLAKRCVLYALEHHTEVVAAFEEAEYYSIMRRMVPHLHASLMQDAGRAPAA